MVGIVFFAHRRVQTGGVPHGKIPHGITEFLLDELHDLRVLLEEFFVHTRPHRARVRGHAVVLFGRGKNIFMERVYGRVMKERGKTASFFLKHIAEHQETLRNNDTPRTPPH